MKNVLSVLVAAIVLTHASTLAAADPPPLQRELSMDLEYKPGPGTESCFSPLGMEIKLIGALTYDPFDREPNPELHVAISVARRKGRFHAEVVLTLADGSILWVEESDHFNCNELLGNIAFIASTQVLLYVLKFPMPKPLEAVPAPSDTPPPPPPSPPAVVPSPPSPLPSPSPPPVTRSDRWRLRGGLGAELSLGLIPGAGVGASAGGGVQWGELLSLNIDVRGVVSISPEEIYGGHSARWYFLGSSLAPCVHIQKAFACPTVHAGARGGLTPNIWLTGNALGVTAAAGLRLGAEWRIGQGYGMRAALDVAYLLRAKVASSYQDELDRANAPRPLAALVSIGFTAAARAVDGR